MAESSAPASVELPGSDLGGFNNRELPGIDLGGFNDWEPLARHSPT